MTFQFKIQIKGITKPPVWRRVEVPATMTFEEFHEVIQTVFPWMDMHLYQFSPKGYGSNPVIAPAIDEMDKPDMKEEKTKLSEFFNAEKQTFTYIYDFGDDWNHLITLEKITDKPCPSPVCLAGKGACPPDDCGGIWGYERLKGILANPSHEEYEEVREWLGLEEDDTWDPDEFDIEGANEALGN